MEAKVVMMKCKDCKKAFGARIERREEGWVFNWAFPIDESIAEKEGFDSEIIEGNVYLDEEYPGCPHCGSKGFVQCTCGKLTCWEGEIISKCAWCGKKAKVGVAEKFRISSGGF